MEGIPKDVRFMIIELVRDSPGIKSPGALKPLLKLMEY